MMSDCYFSADYMERTLFLEKLPQGWDDMTLQAMFPEAESVVVPHEDDKMLG